MTLKSIVNLKSKAKKLTNPNKKKMPEFDEGLGEFFDPKEESK